MNLVPYYFHSMTLGNLIIIAATTITTERMVSIRIVEMMIRWKLYIHTFQKTFALLYVLIKFCHLSMIFLAFRRWSRISLTAPRQRHGTTPTKAPAAAHPCRRGHRRRRTRADRRVWRRVVRPAAHARPVARPPSTAAPSPASSSRRVAPSAPPP